MNVEPPFVADRESAEAVEPGEGALDDPSMSAELLGAFHSAPSNARHDVAPPASVVAAAVVVGFVGVQLVRAAARPAALAADRRNGVDQHLERHAVVDVCASQQEGERNTAAIGREVSFCAGPTAIGRVRAGRGAPFLAAITEPSMHARLQSIRSAFRNRRSSSR
jgi:hypothetical protein